MRSSYNFVDATIYLRTLEGGYINITDYVVSEENPSVSLKSNSKYVLGLCTLFDKKKYVCDITLSELLILAGIHDAAFLRRFKGSLEEEESENLLAVLCAKKIVDYQYGKIKKKDNKDNVFDFQRQSYINKGEKKKRVFPIVLEKSFYEA